MKRTDIINILAKKNNAKSYLEIGVRDHTLNFDKINVNQKVGVDPEIEVCDRAPTFKLTSDEFFTINIDTFDLIFIDGLHEANQVERDILNSLNVLNTDGFIICHDMNPAVWEHQLPVGNEHREAYVSREKAKGNPEYGCWNGDCWKAFVRLRNQRDDIEMLTVDTDYGVGIIQLGTQSKLNLAADEITYENLEKNRTTWLNLISTTEFSRRYE